jgi:hypothetical protein
MDTGSDKKSSALKSKKLFLIFHGRFPSEKAAALFAAESAAAFAGQNYEVTLIAPRRLGRFNESCFDFYGLPKNFKVVFLPTVDLFWIPRMFERPLII